MNRGSILLRLQKHLLDVVPGQSISEFLLESVDDEHKSRSVFITGMVDQNASDVVFGEIERLIGDHAPFYTVQHWFSNDIADLMQNELVPHSSNRFENNWRSRLMTTQQLNIDDEETLVLERLMQSTWRIVITQGPQLDYFVRHDIFPTLWDPGYSIAGFSEYRNQIHSSLEALLVERPRRRLDLEFDVIKCFAKGPGQNHFTQVGTVITANDLIQNPAQIEDQIRGHFDGYTGFQR